MNMCSIVLNTVVHICLQAIKIEAFKTRKCDYLHHFVCEMKVYKYNYVYYPSIKLILIL